MSSCAQMILIFPLAPATRRSESSQILPMLHTLESCRANHSRLCHLQIWAVSRAWISALTISTKWWTKELSWSNSTSRVQIFPHLSRFKTLHRTARKDSLFSLHPLSHLSSSQSIPPTMRRKLCPTTSPSIAWNWMWVASCSCRNKTACKRL